MVGLGETKEEIVAVLKDLNAVGCRIVTIGQYLQPLPGYIPVHEFVPPEQFSDLEKAGKGIGLQTVFSGPFVRSSYRSREIYHVRA
jgi:lipoic acid synthetase